ncbi:MAG: tetratricopeptide repeat protein [Thermoflexibacter sp.]|jgi:tetratricopeptide (TPR) repeat protein|nr:tetratricopeptide repeat protein [Thermoflexibacter sp.]
MKKQISIFIMLLLCTYVAHSQSQQYETNVKALMYFDNLLQVAKTGDLYMDRGLGYFYIGDYENAIKDFEKAIQLGINKPEVYYFKALAKENAGLYKESLSDFDKAIQIGKPNYFHFMHRGYARYKLSMYAQAVEDFTKASTMSPDNEEVKHFLERAIAKRDNKQISNPNDEIQKYISTHTFTSIAEGSAYYDKLEHMGLSFLKFEDASSALRTKVITDVYGEAPTAEQIDELRDILQKEKWLLPEGMEKYFYYVAENPNAFMGEVKEPNFTYYYNVTKDIKGNRYDLTVKKMDKSEMVYVVFTTYIFVNQGTNPDELIIHVHHATGSGMEWRFSPKDYLEVIYSKNSDTVQEKAVGKMTETVVANPILSKAKLLEKDNSKEFSAKEAIRKAVQIMLIAYENVIPKS